MDTSAVYIQNDKIIVFHEYVKACLERGANRMNFFQNSIEDIVINIYLQQLLHSWNTKCLIVPMKAH